MKPEIELSKEQQHAVDMATTASPVLIAAGPGSGKTRTLVSAVARSRDPRYAVVITYTNAAALELRQRLAAQQVVAGFVGTLHAWCLSMLREYGHLVGLAGPIAVVDEDTADEVLEQCASDLGIKGSVRKLRELLEPKLCRPVAAAEYGMSKEHLLSVAYYRRLAKSGRLDFDMVLIYGLEMCRAIAAKNFPYKHLFVDEVQDSSKADWDIYFAAPFASKCFVGDPDQSIYGFRGGDPKMFVDIARSGGSFVASLQENYRCAGSIAYAAQRLIQHNTMRCDKETIPMRAGGSVAVEVVATPGEEMAAVLRNVTGDCAVLVRTNAQASSIADYLSAAGVQVRRRKKLDVPQDWPAAKALLAALAAPANDEAILRLVRLRHGKEVADKLRTEAELGMMPVFELYQLPVLSPEWAANAEGLSEESVERIRSAMTDNPSEILEADMQHELDAQEEGDGVYVGTVHSAKGREWSRVILAGCEEGRFPARGDIEEERRLFFVAMTRAKDSLVLVRCESRPQSRGANLPPGPPMPCVASRFIKEAGL